MVGGREEGKLMCEGRDSRNLKRQATCIQERGNTNLRGKEIRSETSRKQGMGGGSSPD